MTIEQTADRANEDRERFLEHFDPLDPTIVDTFLDEIDAIRERNPVSWNPSSAERQATEGGRWDGFWMLSRYDDVISAAQDWRRYSAAEGCCPVQYDLDVQRLVPLENDPPLHRQIRQALQPFFTPVIVKTYEGAVRKIVKERLEACLVRTPCDFVAMFCRGVPLQVFNSIFLPDETEETATWLLENLEIFFAHPELIPEKVPVLIDWCRRTVGDRQRLGKRDDLVGVIAHMGDGVDDEPFEVSERQRIETLWLMIMAGMETTANMLGHAGRFLATDQALRSELRGAPVKKTERAVREFLRIDPTVPTGGRTLTENVDLGGCPMRAGDRVLLNWAAASRDPRKFPGAATVDISRANVNQHATFGHGSHRCLGSHLAELEIRVMVEEICELSKFELVPGSELHHRTETMRGYRELPISCER